MLQITICVILSQGGDIMAVSDAHKRASAKWNSGRDNIMIRPDKETGAAIRAAAAAAGKSVQQFILAAVEEFMSKEK